MVTIVCPTFNHAPYIEETLGGFLIQETTFPFEILVYNDASTDDTTAIVERYRQVYPSLIRHVVNETNRYSLGKRVIALALAHARGRYVALCEGDDYWTDPAKLELQVGFLDSHPDYVLTFHRFQSCDDVGRIDRNTAYGVRHQHDLSAPELQREPPIPTLTTCFRNVIQSFPPEFEAARIGDLFLWSLLGQYGKGKYMAEIAPARYRRHRTSTFAAKSVQVRLDMRLYTYSALAAYYTRIGDEDNAMYFKSRAAFAALRSIGLRQLGGMAIQTGFVKCCEKVSRLAARIKAIFSGG